MRRLCSPEHSELLAAALFLPGWVLSCHLSVSPATKAAGAFSSRAIRTFPGDVFDSGVLGRWRRALELPRQRDPASDVVRTRDTQPRTELLTSES